MSDTVADILERAADLIEPEGAWTQGENHVVRNGRNCYCMMGALDRVFEETRCTPVVWDAAWQFLRRQLGGSVIGFNDAPERTQEEVVAKLREAAAKARESGK